MDGPDYTMTPQGRAYLIPKFHNYDLEYLNLLLLLD